MDAWQIASASAPERPILLMLGTGSGAGWLRARIDELGDCEIQWRDEYVLDRGIIGLYLSAADVYVLPSRQEGFPVAPIEAMAAGLPLVATDAPGVRAVAGDGDEMAGVIVPREDAIALSMELRRLLCDRDLIAALSARATRRVADRFSLDAVGARLRAFVVPEPHA